MNFIERLHTRARAHPKRIVFAEGKDPRILEACKEIEKLKIAFPILVENPEENPHFEAYKLAFQALRNSTPEEAHEKMKEPHYFATMMVHQGDADGMISGPTASARTRILPALEIIKTKIDHHKVSGAMIMLLPSTVNPDAANGGVLFFADCAVNIEPSVEVLAQIAIDTAQTAKSVGMDPKIALLSFSTAGSTIHPLAQKMQDVAALVKHENPDLLVEGEVQADAALIDPIAQIKNPKSTIGGKANILIFPNLEAGNIAYKLVEQLAGASVIGPILQGLKKPINEVSRACTVEEIVNLTAFTVIQSS